MGEWDDDRKPDEVEASELPSAAANRMREMIAVNESRMRDLRDVMRELDELLATLRANSPADKDPPK